MGRKQINLKNIFIVRPMLMQYNNLHPEVKEVVDYTVKESLKANSGLRISKFPISKTIEPKKDNLWFLPWTDIIELRIAISEKNMFDVFRIVYEINESDFTKIEMFNAFAAYKWVVDQFRAIVEIEVQELSSEPSEEEKEAGADELQEFGYSIMLDAIAKGDLLKYDDYLKLPYAKIFRKLCMDKKRYEINKNIQQNASRKAQRNSR